MSAEISYVQLKVANEARAAVSFVSSSSQSDDSLLVVAGRGEGGAKEAKFVGADSALFAGRRVLIAN